MLEPFRYAAHHSGFAALLATHSTIATEYHQKTLPVYSLSSMRSSFAADYCRKTNYSSIATAHEKWTQSIWNLDIILNQFVTLFPG